MRNIKFGILIVLFGSCNSERRHSNFRVIFNENDYNFIGTKKDSNSRRISEYFIHKNDTSKRLVKAYWDNGKLLSSIFYHRRKKNGPMKMHDINGKLVFEGMYINDLQNGLTLYFKNDSVVDLQIFYRGRELLLDSFVRMKLITGQ